MTNSSRNTLVLAVLLLLSGLISLGMMRRSTQWLEYRKGENQIVQDQINDFRALVASREDLEYEYQKQMAMVSQQSKVVMDHDDSAVTYDYLLKILRWLDRDLIYDFSLANQEPGVYNEYVISGRSNYMDLVHFTRLLEYQRAVLILEDITISSESVAHSDTVGFSMIFRTHYHDNGVPVSEISYKSQTRNVSSYSLFKAKYSESLPELDDQSQRYVNIDNCTLIAISEDRAFLRDNSGLIRILSIQDRVLWGYLHKIDKREGAAIFKVNKYGFEENQILYLTKETEESQ